MEQSENAEAENVRGKYRRENAAWSTATLEGNNRIRRSLPGVLVPDGHCRQLVSLGGGKTASYNWDKGMILSSDG